MTVSSDLPSDWDAWLLSAGLEASFTQTSCWACINKAINGAVPYAIEVEAGGHRSAAALFGHRRPMPSCLIQRAKDLLSGTAGGYLECFGGPVIVGEAQMDTLSVLLGRIDQLARYLGVAGVSFSAPPSTASWVGKREVEDVFARFGYQAMPWSTALVDIDVPDDKLLAGFRQAARKGIRRCSELGIDVRECLDSKDYIENFSRPLFETRKALGQDHGSDVIERHWWDMDPLRHYHYYVAQDGDGRILGTLGTYRWNGVVTEIMSERTMPAREQNLPVQDLLHWEAFRAHRELGDRVFDLAGFSPDPVDEKERGIRAFKEKWKGRIVSIPRFERSFLAAPYRLARAGYRRLRR